MAPSFLAVNANKRSITLDLRKPEAVEIVKRLAEAPTSCGRTSGPASWTGSASATRRCGDQPAAHLLRGLGLRPDRAGAATAAFDGKLQAMSGIMSITGPRTRGPTRAGFALCDTIGGMTAAFAVASALYQRTHTGSGQLVDVAMLDAALAFSRAAVSEYTVAGHRHRQIGNGSVTRKPTGNRFATGDGDLVLAVMTEKQFASLMSALGRAGRARRPAVRGLARRGANEPALREIIEGGAGRRRRQDLGGAADRGRRAVRRHLDDRRDRRHPQLEHRDVLQAVDSATARCGWSARASASPTAAAASTARRRRSASTPTRSSRGGLRCGRDRGAAPGGCRRVGGAASPRSTVELPQSRTNLPQRSTRSCPHWVVMAGLRPGHPRR